MHLEKCPDCLAGKQNSTHRLSPQDSDRKKMPLELLHTDLCDTNAKSHLSSQSFVNFIDDYS